MIWRTFIRSPYTWSVLACLILGGLVLPPIFLKNIGFVYLVKGINHDNDARELSKAQSILESAQDLNTKAPSPVYGLILASHYAGLEEQSLQWAEKGIRIAPNDPFMQLALADELDANNQTEEALIYWSSNGLPQLLKMRAITAEDQLNWPLAEKWYTLYLSLRPQDRKATVQLAESYRKQNELSQAENVLEKYLADSPNDAAAYHQVALVFLAQNDTDRAASAFLKAIQLDPSDYWSIIYLSNIYLSQRQYDDASTMIDKAIQLNPDYPTSYFNLGRISAARQNWVEAEEEFNKAIELANQWNLQHRTPTIGSTELARYYQELAQVKLALGSIDEARKAAEKAVQLDPENAQAKQMLNKLK